MTANKPRTSHNLARLHAALTAGWLLLAVPSALWWKNSIPYLVAVSVYANFASHFSAWQASKAEEAARQGEP